MADAGALRGPAVAGHAGAVVQHVGDVQLHLAVHSRWPAENRESEHVVVYNLSRLQLVSRDRNTRKIIGAREKERGGGKTDARIAPGLDRLYVELEGDTHESQVPLLETVQNCTWWLIPWGNTSRARSNSGESRGCSRSLERGWRHGLFPVGQSRSSAPVPCHNVR